MRLYELSIPNSQVEAIKILKKAGWTAAGSGMYARVYTKNDNPYVLKIFQSRDKAYIDFIKMVLANPNIHFPKFRGRLIKINNFYYAVRMEKLKTTRSTKISGIIDEYLRYGRDMLEYGEERKKQIERYETYKNILKYFEKEPELKKACDIIISNLFPKYYNDVHDSNIMKRGSTIVLTDPVCI